MWVLQIFCCHFYDQRTRFSNNNNKKKNSFLPCYGQQLNICCPVLFILSDQIVSKYEEKLCKLPTNLHRNFAHFAHCMVLVLIRVLNLFLIKGQKFRVLLCSKNALLWFSISFSLTLYKFNSNKFNCNYLECYSCHASNEISFAGTWQTQVSVKLTLTP